MRPFGGLLLCRLLCIEERAECVDMTGVRSDHANRRISRKGSASISGCSSSTGRGLVDTFARRWGTSCLQGGYDFAGRAKGLLLELESISECLRQLTSKSSSSQSQAVESWMLVRYRQCVR